MSDVFINDYLIPYSSAYITTVSTIIGIIYPGIFLSQKTTAKITGEFKKGFIFFLVSLFSWIILTVLFFSESRFLAIIALLDIIFLWIDNKFSANEHKQKVLEEESNTQEEIPPVKSKQTVKEYSELDNIVFNYLNNLNKYFPSFFDFLRKLLLALVIMLSPLIAFFIAFYLFVELLQLAGSKTG